MGVVKPQNPKSLYTPRGRTDKIILSKVKKQSKALDYDGLLNMKLYQTKDNSQTAQHKIAPSTLQCIQQFTNTAAGYPYPDMQTILQSKINELHEIAEF